MKTISAGEAHHDLERVLDEAQRGRVVITRRNRPSVVLIGVETYDAEDLAFANSTEFWALIGSRRSQGKMHRLADVKARLIGRTKTETKPGKKARARRKK